VIRIPQKSGKSFHRWDKGGVESTLDRDARIIFQIDHQVREPLEGFEILVEKCLDETALRYRRSSFGSVSLLKRQAMKVIKQKFILSERVDIKEVLCRKNYLLSMVKVRHPSPPVL
jgi:hypothetical protein